MSAYERGTCPLYCPTYVSYRKRHRTTNRPPAYPATGYCRTHKDWSVSMDHVKIDNTLKKLRPRDFDYYLYDDAELAITLLPTEVLSPNEMDILDHYAPGHVDLEKIHSRHHSDGWTIQGKVIEDYYPWVNDFDAFHPLYGRVWGNFESSIFATSQIGLDHFIENHPPQIWDYRDI